MKRPARLEVVTRRQFPPDRFNYPTLSDLYRHASLKAIGEQRLREGAKVIQPPD